MTEDESEAESDEHVAEEEARRRDADHLRLLTWLLVVYTPFVLLPLFGDAWSALWRLASRDVATFLPLARGVVVAVATPIAAWALAARRARTFCVVTAFLVAWDWPGGTIVGLATLMVLARPNVAELFEDAESERRAAAPSLDEAARRVARRSARRRRRRAVGAGDRPQEHT